MGPTPCLAGVGICHHARRGPHREKPTTCPNWLKSYPCFVIRMKDPRNIQPVRPPSSLNERRRRFRCPEAQSRYIVMQSQVDFQPIEGIGRMWCVPQPFPKAAVCWRIQVFGIGYINGGMTNLPLRLKHSAAHPTRRSSRGCLSLAGISKHRS